MFCFNEFALQVKHKINSTQILGFILICLYFRSGHFYTCVLCKECSLFLFKSWLSFQRLCRLLWRYNTYYYNAVAAACDNDATCMLYDNVLSGDVSQQLMSRPRLVSALWWLHTKWVWSGSCDPFINFGALVISLDTVQNSAYISRRVLFQWLL